ncbi:hypothetical protein B0H66DRAFT_592976 [Apodospora peruviana]|uniref:Uncharacterized protein n=1 Tax=Apodospora peruviana TaxID=516989 RepID=A0AAE0M2P6_9PEZI|nr:hypothetical protein B0H66DRAFT_592976 [Apodospora peruviana]
MIRCALAAKAVKNCQELSGNCQEVPESCQNLTSPNNAGGSITVAEPFRNTWQPRDRLFSVWFEGLVPEAKGDWSLLIVALPRRLSQRSTSVYGAWAKRRVVLSSEEGGSHAVGNSQETIDFNMDQNMGQTLSKPPTPRRRANVPPANNPPANKPSVNNPPVNNPPSIFNNPPTNNPPFPNTASVFIPFTPIRPWMPPQWTRPIVETSNIERVLRSPGEFVKLALPTFDSNRTYQKHEQVIRNGPFGVPVYDDLGYQLSYEMIMKDRSDMTRNEEIPAGTQQSVNELQQISAIVGRPGKGSAMLEMAWRDRVARDLDIPYHTVGVPEYAEWKRCGYSLGPEELVECPKEDMDRLWALHIGSKFRDPGR